MIPNEKLVNIIKRSYGTDLGNKLMRLPDRELALSMMYMQEGERDIIYNLLSAEKVKRIHCELLLHKRLQIRYMQYRLAIDHVTQILASEKKAYPLKSYLRPYHSTKS